MLSETTNPETVEAAAELASALVNFILVIVLPLIALKVRQYTNVKIEEKHMRVLHQAANTWADTAVRNGVTEASQASLESLRLYWEESAPDAVRALHPNNNVLVKIATSHISQKLREHGLLK